MTIAYETLALAENHRTARKNSAELLKKNLRGGTGIPVSHHRENLTHIKVFILSPWVLQSLEGTEKGFGFPGTSTTLTSQEEPVL